MTTLTRTYTPTDTDNVLAAMLTENTGTHMLDSGGAYGRAWQRNQGQTAETFYAADPVRLEIWDDEFEGVTLDVFHWLRERVDYDEDGDKAFHEFAVTMPDDGWMQVCSDYVDHLRDMGHDVAGFWGEGDPNWVNTYNGEDALSATLQYMDLEIDGDPKVLLQIHGGCDVRGGYTTPRMFDTNEEYQLYDNANISAFTQYPEDKQRGGGLFPVASVEDIWWDSDNAGYSWAANGAWTGNDQKPEWKVVDGKVIYVPWETEVHFSGR